jgi:tRNA(Ile)-lysidine synthase
MLRLRVRRTIEAHAMLAPGGRVLVALSGGADSVALLHLLLELHAAGDLVVAGAAHFNHALRQAADDDEAFCRDLAASLGVPFEAGRADIRALARAERRSLEDTARRARYAFLETAARRLRAEAIAVGHTRDDQAETFLLRLLRGAGPRGLAGIRPKSGRVIRPLIEIARDELRAYVAQQQLAFREDESNADLSIPRNRIRRALLPVLSQFSPGVIDVLAREADIAREDEDFLSRAAIDLLPGIVLTNKHGITLEAGPLRALHPALGSRVVREALERAAPDQFFGRDHIRAVLTLAGDPALAAGCAVTVPGLHIRRVGSRLFVEPAGHGVGVRPFENSFLVPLSIPGEVSLPGWTLSAVAAAERTALEFSRAAVAVAADGPKLPLAVRSRRPGDRFRPLGMGGRGRKLQDFLVDRKVPRNERDALPLVVDSDDRIVWVVGQSVAEDFRVIDPARGVILLKARRLGGEG